jgi:hypothetical protein
MSHSLNPSLVEEGLGALTIGANLLASPLTRRWYANWGATDEEIKRPLPGDEVIPNAQLITNRAITIHAPIAQVWPWLVQLGQGRGGLYTFQRLENLARCQIINVNEIRPELQDLAAGDFVRLGPEGYPYYIVQAILPEEALILVTPPGDDASTAGTWVFCVEAVDSSTTRLIVRSRLTYVPTIGNRLIWRVMTDPMFFVMERRMLIGIRDRAEALAKTATLQQAPA